MIQRYILLFVFIAALAVYGIGLQVDVIQIDSAQYASIARELADNGQWLQIQHRGKDYLDKPPLLFWLAALSFKLFGVHNWSFKLPALLFTLLGVYATYRLAAALYDYRVGRLAAVMLFTCQAYFLFNHDVRTDALLTACVMMSVWLIYEYLQHNEPKYGIGGFVCIALGMLAKGPIALMIPAWSIGTHLLLKKEFRKLFHPKWLAGLLLVAVIIAPTCWGLYNQFGWNGVKFFLWTQSFGRITGENPWRNEAGPLFLLHNFLWAFLPWSALALYALCDMLVAYLKRWSLPEYLSLGGFIITLIALSFSKYKLPHYVFVTLPFAAIFTAEVIETQICRNKQLTRFFRYLQLSIIVLTSGLLVAGYFIIFPVRNLWLPTFSLLLIAFSVYVYFLKIADSIVMPSALAAVAFNLMLNAHFYPSLLKYQAGGMAARIVRQMHIPTENLFFYERNSHALEFYLKTTIPPVWDVRDLLQQSQVSPLWIYSEGNILQHLEEKKIRPLQIIELDNYPVQFLSLEFLNPKTRNATLQKSYLIKIR